MSFSRAGLYRGIKSLSAPFHFEVGGNFAKVNITEFCNSLARHLDLQSLDMAISGDAQVLRHLIPPAKKVEWAKVFRTIAVQELKVEVYISTHDGIDDLLKNGEDLTDDYDRGRVENRLKAEWTPLFKALLRRPELQVGVYFGASSSEF